MHRLKTLTMKSKDSCKPLLLFDFGAILVGLSKQRCIEALQRIGCGKIAYYVDECRQEDLFHELEVGGSVETFCDEARRQSSFTDETGVFHPCTATDEQIIWAWNELLTGVPVEKLRMIRHLHDDLGYRTAMLSNTNEIHWEKSVKDFFTVEGLKVEDYFDHIFLSCRMNKVKPDDAVYQEMLQETGEKPENILFIDDSETNCKAAERNGIRTLHDPKGDMWMHKLLEMLDGEGRAAVIGNFDGVHKGHLSVINNLRDVARERGLEPLIITFDRHPRSLFVKDFHPEFLTTLDERVALLRQALTPVDDDEAEESVTVLPFTQEMADTPARDFMEHILRDKLNVRLLLLGYDNHFGKKNPEENFETYRRYGEELGIEVLKAQPCDVGEVRVSSSAVRKMIKAGDIECANECLGYPYSITGTVVHGYEEGRKMGFPTANILPPDGKLMPPDGVYASRVRIDGDKKVRYGMTNVGTRPTFHGTNVTIETNILGFIGNVYGKVITIELLSMVRPEVRFDSPQELRKQIEKDRGTIETYIEKETKGY